MFKSYTNATSSRIKEHVKYTVGFTGTSLDPCSTTAACTLNS